MVADRNWKLQQAACESAQRKGEEVARIYGFESWPINPFAIIAAERELIHAEGDDFGEAFDGRLSYVGPRFLLCYNTRYNAWPRRSEHHPKVRFTVAHELGHFYLDRHRKHLVTRRQPHGSFVEFESDRAVERQADCFAAGLLTPQYLLGPRVNCEPDATVETIKEAATDFDVSLTSMMVRWTQLSHFPSATLCVRAGQIAWGFVSEGFRNAGLWRARRGARVAGIDAQAFLEKDTSLESYREGQGTGLVRNWLEWDGDRISVSEFYIVIPYTRSVMVYVIADEDDLSERWSPDD